MMNSKPFQQFLLNFIIGVLFCIEIAIPAVAQGTFIPPSDGAPGDREDAGSRPGCPAANGSFLALVPATNIGKTIAEHPTFWLYIPYENGLVEFILEDEISKEQIYKTTFPVEQGSGIIRYQLAETAPPLEIDKKYRWRFFFFCDPQKQSDFLSVNGVIFRESLETEKQTQLETLLPLEKVALYGENGLWHEMLTELARLYQMEPENAEVKAAWLELLQHPMVRLDSLISAPLVPCCTSN